MPDVSFLGLFIVTIVAFLAPLLLGLSPLRRLPTVVLEIVAGIIIGPSVLHWVKVDLPIQILSSLGLAFLLFLAGLEVELQRLRGRLMINGDWVSCCHLGWLCLWAMDCISMVWRSGF